MFLRTLCLMLGLTVLASASYATDVQMVQVASSYPAGYTGKLTSTLGDSGEGITKFTFKDTHGTDASFTVDELHKGKVLIHALGKDILKIVSPEFSPKNGGQLILSFLRGFLGSDHREVHFDYTRRGGETDWVLETDDTEGREPFDSLLVVVSKTLGLPTGVGDVVLSLADRTIRHYDPSHLPSASHLIITDGEPVIRF